MLRSDSALYRLRYIGGIVLCLLIGAIALRLPDLDQVLRIPPLILHRSALFHSALLPLLFLYAVVVAGRIRPEGPIYSHPHANPVPRLVGVGIGTALAAHFCFDLFPHWWRGWSLVYMPFYGRLSPTHSFLWLVVSALVCLWAVCCMLRNRFDLGLSVACVAACYGYSAYREPDKAVYALLALAVCGGVAFILPRFGFNKMSDGLTSMLDTMGR